MRHDIDIARSWKTEVGRPKLTARHPVRQLTDSGSVTADSGCDAVLHLTAVNAVPFSWKEEKFEPVASGLLSSRQSPEISGEERSVKPELEGNRFLAALEMTDVFVTRLLTIKYYSSPSRRIAGTTKNAHLSMFNQLCFKRAILKLTMVNADTTTKEYAKQSERIRHLLVSSVVENRGTGDNKLNPFFLISSTLYISSPAGGSPEGEGGNGTVANINKTSAYET